MNFNARNLLAKLALTGGEVQYCNLAFDAVFCLDITIDEGEAICSWLYSFFLFAFFDKTYFIHATESWPCERRSAKKNRAPYMAMTSFVKNQSMY